MTVRVSTLDNGLRVVTTEMPGLETTALGVWVDVGARFETAFENGVSHMLEHMAFKGTRRRGPRQIAEEIESVGGHLNAYTSREQTAYFARILANDVPLAMDLLGDILRNSTLEPVELERERTVILQEIGEVHDIPDDLVFDLLQEAAYPDQPAGRPVLGTPETVSRLSREGIESYMRAHYRGERMVLSAAGKIDHDALVGLAEEHLGSIEADRSAEAEPAVYRGGEIRHRRDFDQAHVTLAFPGVAFQDPDYYAGQVYSAVMGGGMSSRLFQEVRESRGLAYSVHSFAGSMTDSGMFGIYAGTGPDDVPELVSVLADEMGRSVGDITEEELLRAKAQIKAGLLMGLESAASRCEQAARQMQVLDRVLTPEELAARIDEVDLSDLSRVARRHLEGPLSVAAVGPVEKLESADRLRTRFAA